MCKFCAQGCWYYVHKCCTSQPFRSNNFPKTLQFLLLSYSESDWGVNSDISKEVSIKGVLYSGRSFSVLHLFIFDENETNLVFSNKTDRGVAMSYLAEARMVRIYATIKDTICSMMRYGRTPTRIPEELET
jgi:hypothetical protein